MLSLKIHYLILTTCVCLGVIQATAAYSNLRGLLIVPRAVASYVIALAVPIAAFTWFILMGDVGIPGDVGGVEGAQQFTTFLIGAFAAGIGSAVLASLTQWGHPASPDPAMGMEGFRNATAFQLLIALFRRGTHADR